MKSALGKFAGVTRYVGDLAYKAAAAGFFDGLSPFPMCMHTESTSAPALEPTRGRNHDNAAAVPANDP